MTGPALTLVMTSAGLGRFTAAQASDDIDLTIASVGLTAAPFVVAPTLTALPGEFRRVTTIAGSSIGDNIVHMIVRDDSDLAYDVRGFGLFLADGTLFAVYGQPTVIVGKSTGSSLLLALDVAFPAEDIAQLTFGDTNFLNPPATTAVKGVVELATRAEGLAGTDTQRVPPVAVVAAMIDAIPSASTDHAGLVELATPAEGLAGSDQLRVPPVAVVAAMIDAIPYASTDDAGLVELASLAEGLTGADPNRAPPVSVVRAMMTALLPTGSILLWASAPAAVPAGWALCDGRTVERLDGSGPIATPDLRGRVAVGASAERVVGAVFGAATVEPQTSESGSHGHDLTVTVDSAVTGVSITTTTRNVDAGGSAGGVLISATPQDNGHAHTATATATAAGAHSHSVSVDVTQPSIALHYIMRL